MVKIEDLQQKIEELTAKTFFSKYTNQYYNLFFEIVQPNISLDQKFTTNALDESLSNIAVYRGLIQKNTIIISQGEVVEGEKYQMLDSLKKEYASQMWNELSYYWIIFGYTILVVLTFMSLILFINNYRPSIFEDNREITFIFLNMVGMIALTTIVVNFDVKFLYAVPICILPLILKTFFDPRLGLFTHVITILNLGFVVPNSFEFVFLQIMAGIITIQSYSQLYRRANLFISVGQNCFGLSDGLYCFYTIHEGSVSLN